MRRPLKRRTIDAAEDVERTDWNYEMSIRSLPVILFVVSLALLITALFAPAPKVDSGIFPEARFDARMAWEHPAYSAAAPASLKQRALAAGKAAGDTWRMADYTYVPPGQEQTKVEAEKLDVKPPLPLAPRAAPLLPVRMVLNACVPYWPEPAFDHDPGVKIGVSDYDRIFTSNQPRPVVGEVIEENTQLLRVRTLEGGVIPILKSEIKRWEKKRDIETALRDAVKKADTPEAAADVLRVVLRKIANPEMQKLAFARLHELISTGDAGRQELIAAAVLPMTAALRYDPEVLGWAGEAADRLRKMEPQRGDYSVLAGDISALSGNWNTAVSDYKKAGDCTLLSAADVSLRKLLAGAVQGEVEPLRKALAGEEFDVAGKRLLSDAFAALLLDAGNPYGALEALRGSPLPKPPFDPLDKEISVEDAVEIYCGSRPDDLKDSSGFYGRRAALTAAALLMTGNQPLAKFLVEHSYASAWSPLAQIIAAECLIAEADYDSTVSRLDVAVSRQGAHLPYAYVMRARARLLKYDTIEEKAPTDAVGTIIGTEGAPSEKEDIEKKFWEDVNAAAQAMGIMPPLPGSTETTKTAAEPRLLAELYRIVADAPFSPPDNTLTDAISRRAATVTGQPRFAVLSDPNFDPASVPPPPVIKDSPLAAAEMLRQAPLFDNTKAVSGLLEEPAIKNCVLAEPGEFLLSCDINLLRLRAYALLSAEKDVESVACLERVVLSAPIDDWAADLLSKLRTSERTDSLAAGLPMKLQEKGKWSLVDDEGVFRVRSGSANKPVPHAGGVEISCVGDKFADPNFRLAVRKRGLLTDFQGFSAELFVYGDNEAEVGIGFKGKVEDSDEVIFAGCLAYTRELPDNPAAPLLRTSIKRIGIAGALEQVTRSVKQASQDAAKLDKSLPPAPPPEDIVKAKDAATALYAEVKKAEKVIERAKIYGSTKSLADLVTALEKEIEGAEKNIANLERAGSFTVERSVDDVTAEFLDNNGEQLPGPAVEPVVVKPESPRAMFNGTCGGSVRLALIMGEKEGAPALLAYRNGRLYAAIPLEDITPNYSGVSGVPMLFISTQKGQKIHVRIDAVAYDGRTAQQ